MGQWSTITQQKSAAPNQCHYFILWIKWSSCIKTHNVITDNCKKIRLEYQPSTEKHHSSFRRYCGLQICQIWIWLTTACGASCKRRSAKHASLISTTSNIASELSGPRWITPSLLQLCVSGVDIFQLVWMWVVVISSTAFNSNIRKVVGWYSGLIFLHLSVMTLCVLIHDDHLIHKIK